MDGDVKREEAERGAYHEVSIVMRIQGRRCEAWLGPTRESFHADFRFAHRQFCKIPEVVVTAILVLALGISVVLLAAAGHLGKSFYRILTVDLNSNRDHVATRAIDANTGYETAARQLERSSYVMDTVSAYPGVRAAGIVSAQISVTCHGDTAPYCVFGRPWNGRQPLAMSRTVRPNRFATLQCSH